MRQGFVLGVGLAIGVAVSLSLGATAPQAADSNNGPMILGTGGGKDNTTDLCWVLARVKPAKGPDRTVLALYRARQQGEYFDLQDVRMIDGDLRMFELKKPKHKAEGTDVEAILKLLPKEEQETLTPK